VSRNRLQVYVLQLSPTSPPFFLGTVILDL